MIQNFQNLKSGGSTDDDAKKQGYVLPNKLKREHDGRILSHMSKVLQEEIQSYYKFNISSKLT